MMFAALVRAEMMKLRRAAPVRLAIGAPVLMFALELLNLFASKGVNPVAPDRFWRDSLGFGWIFWLGLFMPALIVFEAIWLANVEHGGRHWKQLFTMPAPRWMVFAVKMLMCGLLVGAAFAIFAATSVTAVLIFSGVRGLHLGGSIPWLEVLDTGLRAYAACWPLIVAHTWLSVRYPGFAVPAGVAFTAMLAGVLLLNLSPASFGWWYPWTLPLAVRPQGLYDSHNTLAPAVFGVLAGLAAGAIAAWDLGRRQDQV